MAVYSFMRKVSGEGAADLFPLVSRDIQWFKAASGKVQTRHKESFT